MEDGPPVVRTLVSLSVCSVNRPLANRRNVLENTGGAAPSTVYHTKHHIITALIVSRPWGVKGQVSYADMLTC